ncbi:hypothetical protein V7201_16530 [Bacillus sp. JJ1122]|uniref:hypothetical protein n=1 Tax=Bacillus sp. JJ1122 TaxID=3122951 RepID=UPI00300043E3
MNPVAINEIIDEVTKGIYRDYPVLLEKYGEQGRKKCREDNEHHIKHLQTALSMGDDQFFIDYAHWLNGILTSRGMKTDHLVDNFERLQSAFRNYPDENSSKYIRILEDSIHSLRLTETQE